MLAFAFRSTGRVQQRFALAIALVIPCILAGLAGAWFLFRDDVPVGLDEPVLVEARYIAQHGRAVIEAVENLREATGSYPDEIETVSDASIVDGYGPGGIRWHYLRDGRDAFELGCAIGRGLNSYDFMVWRSDGFVDGAWMAEAIDLVDFDGWCYVVGAERVKFIASRDSN